MVKQIPILYNTEMVKAVQREVNEKTQTRRTKGLNKINVVPDDWSFVEIDPAGSFIFEHKNIDETFWVNCPYGKVGDILFVRETSFFNEYHYVYAANLSNEDYKWFKGCWKPSIHMPKEAARIWLEITDIKVERLKDISEEDSIAEGVEPVDCGYKNYMTEPKLMQSLKCFDKAYYSFLSLWESINGCDSWLNNPWVWVITFKKVAKP